MKKTIVFLGLLTALIIPDIVNAQLWYEETFDLDRSAWNRSMTVTCVLNIEGVESRDPNDVVGAFVDDGTGTLECRGVARVDQYIPSIDRYVAYLIVSSAQVSGETVIFKIYDKSADEINDVPNTLEFVDNGNYGYATDPYIVYTSNPPTDIMITNNTVPENTTGNIQVGILSTADIDDVDVHTYTLVEGEGSENNGLFSINGDKLETSHTFNYEQKNQYTVRIQTDDGHGHKLQKQFTIEIVDVNDRPTDLAIDNNSVVEMLPVGTVVGNITAEDEDIGDELTYYLSKYSNFNGTDYFEVKNNQIITTRVLDYENSLNQHTYQFYLNVKDVENDGYAIIVKIFLQNANDQPTDIDLSNNETTENLPVRTDIGAFTTTDADNHSSYTYTLVEGETPDDNDKFMIDGNVLKTNTPFDFEAREKYYIYVQTDDNSGGTYVKRFEIKIIDGNDEPTVLSNNIVTENLPSRTDIGTFSTVEIVDYPFYVYTLVEGWSPNDNEKFLIEGNTLKTFATFDFETKSTYQIFVETDNVQGIKYIQQYEINIADANDAPTDFTLNSTEVPENEPAGTPVGTFYTTDPDNHTSYTYTLVDGLGGEDNAMFDIQSNQLVTAQTFNYEINNSYSLLIQVDDNNGGKLIKQFTISITDANDTPTDIALDNKTIDEKQPIGTTIGYFSTTDEDEDTFAYNLASVASPNHNSKFKIVGNELQSFAIYDYETQNQFTVFVESKDAALTSVVMSFNIQVNDLNDNPTNISLSNNKIVENSPVGSFIGTFNTTDQDADNFTYRLVEGESPNDNTAFLIDGNQLLTNQAVDYETKNLYYINIETNDGNGGILTKQFAISILRGNDPPTGLTMSDTMIDEKLPAASLVGYIYTEDIDGDSNTHEYSLVNGYGGEDNSMFDIVDNQLISKIEFNYEIDNDYSVLIRTTDQDGAYFTKQFTIQIVNKNDIPTQINLSNKKIDENLQAGSTVGTFSTIDEDINDTFVYTLIEGDGAADNDDFLIEGNTLKTAITFDVETTPTASIRVKSTDSKDGTTEMHFLIKIGNLNDAPNALVMSNQTIDENMPYATEIGEFTTTDPDVSDTHTYSFYSAEGNDNSSFIIDGNILKSAIVFDYETKSIYNVFIQTSDGYGGVYQKQFAITVINGNDAPTDITLSNNSVKENLAAGTIVGSFTTSDLDATDSHSYSLAVGIGDDNNDLFEIDGNKLKTKVEFDYETENTFSVLVQTTDNMGGTYLEAFQIDIVNANDAPYDIDFYPTRVGENQPLNTFVGTLSTFDYDENDTFSYSFVTAAGGEDNSSFVIDGNTIKTSDIFDYEQQSQYSVLIQTRDNKGLTYQKQFTIDIVNQNDAPTQIVMNNMVFEENKPFGTEVGNFIVSDPDIADNHNFSFVTGVGDTNNSDFIIEGNTLKTGRIFDYENETFLSIRIMVTDEHSATLEKQFTLSISNTNDTPTDISVSNLDISEDAPVGTGIGVISSSDQDEGDIFTYELVPGIGHNNGSFEIIDDELRTTAVFDYEVKKSYNIYIKTTDSQNATFIKKFVVNIIGINDFPTSMELSSKKIDEGLPIGTTVGLLTTSDPDTDDIHVYSLIGGEGSEDNLSFKIEGTELRTNRTFDFEDKNLYSIRIQTDDQRGGKLQQIFTINIVNANDAPTDIFISNNSVSENKAIDTYIGTFTTTDVDENEVFIYSLVDDTGSPNDNSRFVIVADELRTDEAFDYEQKELYYIDVQVKDKGGLTYSKKFTININDANDAPTDFEITSTDVVENMPVGTEVGIFTPVDQDINDTHSYSLVSGIGGDDNGRFIISDNRLLTNAVFDTEQQIFHNILVQITDAEGESFTKQLVIRAVNGNDPPTGLAISSNTVAENQVVGTVIGTLITTDPDDLEADAHIYSLVPGDGDTGNNKFSVSDNKLITATVLNFEAIQMHTVRVVTDDGKGGTFEQVLTINVADANDAPTNIMLSNNQIDENSPIGTLIGNFSTTDPDAADTHTYKFASGEENDNNEFIIDDNILKTNSVLNYEEKAFYTIFVESDDGQGGTLVRKFIISIQNTEDDAPTAIALSNNKISESTSTGTTVGLLSTTDIDKNDAHTYQLVAGIGDDDNSSFVIEDNKLILNTFIDYEIQNTYAVRLKTIDNNGDAFEQQFTITVVDANDIPTDIDLSNTVVQENLPLGTVIGTFSTFDQDVDDTHVYRFTAGEGINNNNSFIIDANTLKTNIELDYESKVFYVIHVETDDGKGGRYSRQFTISVAPGNDAPTGMQISSNVIAEKMPVGTVVGHFSTMDIDPEDTHTYTLVNGTGDTDNNLFSISENALKSNALFNFKEKSKYSVRVKTDDGHGGTYEKQFDIVVILRSYEVAENSPKGTFVGTILASEPFTGNVSYNLISGNIANIFEVNTTTGAITVDNETDLNFEDISIFQLYIRITGSGENGNLSEDANVHIDVTDVNDAPLSENQTFEVVEQEEAGTFVGQVVATDVDNGQTLYYQIIDPNIAPGTPQEEIPFAIDELTGEITINNPKLVDYETMPKYTINVKITDNGDVPLSVTIEVVISIKDAAEETLNANNFFSPNNDGINDTWMLQTPELYQDFEVIIFNGMQEIIYESKNYQNNWDGTYEGQELPNGVYYYILKSPDGKRVYKGTISLIR